MKPAVKALIMTMAYQRQAELGIAMQQLNQASKMTRDPGEQQFLSAQLGQMQFMHKELTDAIQRVEAEDKKG